MNDEMGALKARLRRIEGLLVESSLQERVAIAQAVSRARRLVRRADRTRAPTEQLRASVEEAETLASPNR